jgi:WD40 repeat protein
LEKREAKALMKVSSPVHEIEVSHDGKLYYFSMGDYYAENKVLVYNTETKESKIVFDDDYEYHYCIALSPDSQYMIIGNRIIKLDSISY